MIEPYGSDLMPPDDMTRELMFCGALFEVCIACQEPDDPGEVTHPDNYWVERVKLGSRWWCAEDTLSAYLLGALNKALQLRIAKEHREALGSP